MEELLKLFDPSLDRFDELVILIVSIVSFIVIKIIHSATYDKTDSLFIKAMYSSFRLPARWLITWVSLWQIFVIALSFTTIKLGITEKPILMLILSFHAIWYGFRVIKTYELSSLKSEDEGSRLDKTAVTGIAKLLRLLLIAILAIVGFDLLGLDPSGLIALGSVSGAALAFASKDLVSNWFGGIMLYLDKPFKVGDWVRSPDREIEGTVEYIGWRITKIRTFDKRPLYVPNSLFNSITVQNPSRMTHRRINETIGVRYDDMAQVERLVVDIEDYLRASNLIAQDQVIIVNFNGFGASSLNVLVYCMTITTDWVEFHQNKQQVLLDIAKLVEQHGCEFAFPTQTLKLETDSNTKNE